MAQFLNRIGQLGLGVALVGGVVNSALYNGIVSNIVAIIYCSYVLCSTVLSKFFFFFFFSWWRSSGCNFRSFCWYQASCCRRRNAFLYSMGTTSNHFRHSITATKCARCHRQQRFTKCQHYIAYLVPPKTGSIAKNLHNFGQWLWWSCVAIDHNRSVESRCRSIWCRWNDHTAWGEW